ncbi:MAG TPA: hypothetical protein VHS74_05255 [Solirubrobacterales bacterium]|nr:hypothetical protein [Solirubrobacterales bacterium]
MRRYSPLLMILALLGALGLSQVAAATAAQPTAPTTTFSLLHSSAVRDAAPESEEEDDGEEADDEDEVEEVEFEVEEEVLIEECEAAADEFEFEDAAEEKEFEEEVAECEKEARKGKSAAFVSAPEECVVEHAESTIQTLPGSDRIRLTVHYKDSSTGAVAIGLKLKDRKGSLSLEHTTRHLGHDGTLHLITKLGESEMERAEDAREFDVALRAPGTPGYCGHMLEQRMKTAASPAAHGSRAHGSSRVFRAPGKKS